MQEWIDRGGSGSWDVDLYTVATGTDSSQPNYPPSQWLEREQWSLPTLLDDDAGTAGKAYGLSGYPYWVFVDGDGRVAARHTGCPSHRPARADAVDPGAMTTETAATFFAPLTIGAASVVVAGAGWLLVSKLHPAGPVEHLRAGVGQAAAPVGLALAGIGATISVNHYQLEWFPQQGAVACSAEVPCTAVWFRAFGFISLPLMALTAFAAIAVLLLVQTDSGDRPLGRAQPWPVSVVRRRRRAPAPRPARWLPSRGGRPGGHGPQLPAPPRWPTPTMAGR